MMRQLTGSLVAPHVDDQAHLSYLSIGDCDDGLVITWTATSTVLLLTIEKSPEIINEYVRTCSFLELLSSMYLSENNNT